MIVKYPRTPHLAGSRLQPGDEDLDAVPFAEIAGAHVVVEEKLDGANAGICFDDDGGLLLQSRGHYLTGGPRERQFALFKAWASTLRHGLWEALGSRYVLYGEWLYAKHTVFYDALPHYFCEFDVYDRADGVFLSTPRRRALLDGLPIHSVPVLHDGTATSLRALTDLIGQSRCRTPAWRAALSAAARAAGVDPERAAAESDRAEEMEGLYLKVETAEHTVGRLKWVRPSFLTAVNDSGSHWLDRPIIANGLADPGALYGAV